MVHQEFLDHLELKVIQVRLVQMDFLDLKEHQVLLDSLVWKDHLDFQETLVPLVGWATKVLLVLMEKMEVMEILDFLVVLVTGESQGKMECLVPPVQWEKKAHPEILGPQDYLVIRDQWGNGETLDFLGLKDLVEDLVQLVP